MACLRILFVAAALTAVVSGAEMSLVTRQFGDQKLGIGGFPEGSITDSWRLGDGKLHEALTYDSKEAFNVSFNFAYRVKVIRYKLFVGRDTDPTWYPRNWQLVGSKYGEKSSNSRQVLDVVTDAQFDTDGVYVGRFNNPGKHEVITLEVTADSTPSNRRFKIKIAEVKLFGPKGQYERYVEGGYPCKSAPRYIRKRDGKKGPLGGKSFSNRRNAVLDNRALKLFFDDRWDVYRRLRTPRFQEVIIGYHFRREKQVVQFGLDFLNSWYSQRGLGPNEASWVGNFRDLTLQGNKCDPSCDYLGEEGWVTLATGSLKTHFQRKYLVNTPGYYRAYRVKMDPTGSVIYLREVSFLQC